MDPTSIAEFVKTYLIDHWPFVFVAFLLGTIGHVFKTKCWTVAYAKKSRVGFYGRATLPLHAPAAGALFGVIMWLVMKEESVVGPGIAAKAGSIVLYYTGSGTLSAWLFSAWKHFVKSRGIDLPDEFDEESQGPDGGHAEPLTLGPDDITPVINVAPPPRAWRDEGGDEPPPAA
jgi:hypothetical protein